MNLREIRFHFVDGSRLDVEVAGTVAASPIEIVRSAMRSGTVLDFTSPHRGAINLAHVVRVQELVQ